MIAISSIFRSPMLYRRRSPESKNKKTEFESAQESDTTIIGENKENEINNGATTLNKKRKANNSSNTLDMTNRSETSNKNASLNIPPPTPPTKEQKRSDASNTLDASFDRKENCNGDASPPTNETKKSKKPSPQMTKETNERKERRESLETFHPRPSKRLQKLQNTHSSLLPSLLPNGDGDTWIEMKVVNIKDRSKKKKKKEQRTLKTRSLFYSINTQRAWWDEPPTGASRVIYSTQQSAADEEGDGEGG